MDYNCTSCLSELIIKMVCFFHEKACKGTAFFLYTQLKPVIFCIFYSNTPHFCAETVYFCQIICIFEYFCRACEARIFVQNNCNSTNFCFLSIFHFSIHTPQPPLPYCKGGCMCWCRWSFYAPPNPPAFPPKSIFGSTNPPPGLVQMMHCGSSATLSVSGCWYTFLFIIC